MTKAQALLAYVSRLGDNAFVLGQRMLELVAAYPELEEELANANFALDYIGQARMFYSYAADLAGGGQSEDHFAFQRDENEFRNILLIEQPNRDFGDSIAKLVLFESFYLLQLQALVQCADERIAEIAARAEKEITYHLRHNSQWFLRLGDGTEESHKRVQDSLDTLWKYTGEMFAPDVTDNIFEAEFDGPDLLTIRETWTATVTELIALATLAMPGEQFMATGGKEGRHTEHFGYMVAEMQYLQRSHPGATW